MMEFSVGNVWAWAVQAAALAGVGVTLPTLLRMTSPRARLLHFRALLVVCLVLPFLQPWVPGTAASPTVWADVPSVASVLNPATGLPAPDGGAPAAGMAAGDTPSWRRWPVEAVAVGVYLTGVAVRLLWMTLGLLSLARLRRSAAPLEPRPESVETAARLAGADAEFLVSPRVVRPVTFGFSRPVVLVGPAFASFEPGQQTAVAAHELLHVARRDWLRTLGDELVLSAVWFHPVLWWLVEQIRLSMEQLVDRDVVRLVGSRKPYLEALLRLAAAGPAPVLQPASLFLKHGHLAQRVALLVREVPMSRLRLVLSSALVIAVLAAGGWAVVQAFPLTFAPEPAVASLPPSPTRASAPLSAPLPPPAPPSKAGAGQIDGQQAKPTVDPKAQQTNPGAPALPPVPPPPPPPPAERGAGYVAPPPFDPVAWEHAVQVLITRAAAEPSNATVAYTLSVYYWEKAYRDTAIGVAEKRGLVSKGLEQADRAISLKPDYMEALVYKSLLLRSQATLETDPAARQGLIAEAEKLREQAIKIRDAKNPWAVMPANAVRIGGGVAPPTKTKNVMPVYPADALSAKLSGVVIIEAIVGEDGKVRDTRVLRSIPQLDQAAIDAVRQWEFTPTLLNGVAVPVVMTVTVNFAPKELSGVPGGAGGGVPGGSSGERLTDPSAVRVGGDIKPPTKTVHVNPVYPPEARDARVQGVVILDVLIGTDGKVEQTKILRSIPQLDQAAIDAVRQWEFTPTLLNGAATKVIMTVTVNFTLQ